jgi:glycosyltransferase involved in cell wall biosynthesis
VGYVDGDAKRSVLEQSDCFVLPSAHENFGLAVAEALAAGLPAIVTPGVALARDVNGAGAGLVAEATASDLASAIRWAAGHPAALIEMGERAWQLAHRDLSWDRTCERLVALYRELTAPPRREGRRA